MNKEYYKELIERIVDTAWAIKTKYPVYKTRHNLRIATTTVMKFVVYTSDNEEINGMIYYSYLLYIGCLYE